MSSVYTQPLKLNLGGQTEKLLVHWKGCMLATVEIDWSHDFQKLGKEANQHHVNLMEVHPTKLPRPVSDFLGLYIYTQCIYIYMLNVFASTKRKKKKINMNTINH